MNASRLNYFVLCVSLLAIAMGGYSVYKVETAPTRDAFVDLVYLYREFKYTKERGSMYERSMAPLKARLDTVNMQLDYMASGGTAQNIGYAAYLTAYRDSLTGYAENLKAEYDAEIWTRINTYVQEFGKEHRYSIIFGASGNDSVMYSDSSANITRDVLLYMNEKYDGK